MYMEGQASPTIVSATEPIFVLLLKHSNWIHEVKLVFENNRSALNLYRLTYWMPDYPKSNWVVQNQAVRTSDPSIQRTRSIK